MPASPAKKSQWSEYTNSEGRKYWSHATTKQSVWEKPDELKTPFEKALAKTQWKQYTSKDRPYYVNTVTKETKWDLPPELKELKAKIDREEERRAQGLTSPERSRSPTPEDIRELREAAANAIAPYGTLPPPSTESPSSRRGSETPQVQPQSQQTPNVPALPVIVMPPGGFADRAKAEEAFIYLLKREGINEQWTWDQTMRKIIMDPLYKALDTLAEKKGAFEKHINTILDSRRQAKQLRISKLRPIFHKLFASSVEIKSYSTMKTAEKMFNSNRYWREAQYDERAMILEEYVDDLRRIEETAERESRDRNIHILSDLIRTLDISVSTRWREAHDLIVSSEEFKADRELQKIETIDMIQVYDTYARQLEIEHEEESKKLKIENVRKARKARENFKVLLHQLQEQGDLNRSSKFKDVYKKIKDDERYLNLLGLQGSNPLDLFMDHIDDLNEEFETASQKLVRALNKDGKEIKLETTFEELDEWVRELKIDNQFDEKLRKDIYDLIHGKLKQSAEDELRRAERKRRHRIDDLRYALKKVGRHIDLEMTYEEALPHMKDLPEFKEVVDEEDRKVAFEKFIKRQKEKLKEAESSDIGSTRDRERDRDRYEKDRKYSYSNSKDKDRDEPMDIDEKDRDKDRSSRKDRERDRDREDRDRKDKHRDRDRDRDRKRGSIGPDDLKDKDKERESKRRRMSSSSHTHSRKDKDDVEEGEI